VNRSTNQLLLWAFYISTAFGLGAVFLRTIFTDHHLIELLQAYGLQFVWLILSVREEIIPLNLPFYCQPYLVFQTILAFVLLALPGFQFFYIVSIHPSYTGHTDVTSQPDVTRADDDTKGFASRYAVNEFATEVLSSVQIIRLGCCLTRVDFLC